MDENLIKDILKIGRLITKPENIQEQVIGMGSETGLANTKTYVSPPEKKTVTPEKINMNFYTTIDYTVVLSTFQPYMPVGVQSVLNPPEKKIIVKKGTKGNRTENNIVVGGFSYKCGTDLLSKSNPNNILNPYSYSSPELIKTLKNVCSWTMSSYKELLNKETETKTDDTKTDDTKTDDTKTAQEISDEQCSLDCNQRLPYYSVACDGGNWKTTLNSWISEKGGGKNKETYISLRTSWCSGWRPGQTQKNLVDFITPIFSDSATTTTTVLPQNNQPTVF